MQFLNTKTDVIITTSNNIQNLINENNIDYVIYYDVPSSIEDIYEKICLIKRDKTPLDVILLFKPTDIAVNKYLIEQEPSYMDKINENAMLDTVIDYLNTDKCLRRYLFDYFGKFSNTFYCKNCSSCNREDKFIDVTVDAQKVLSCIKRIENRFGVNMFVDILRGAKLAKMGQLNFSELSTYGIMRNYTKETIKEIIEALIAEEYIEAKGKSYPILSLTPKASNVLFKDETVSIKDSMLKTISKKDIKSNRNYDKELFKILREVRHKFATKNSLPPFIILLDSTLIDMCKYYPLNREACIKISGLSGIKYDRYGDEFVEAIRDYLEDVNEELYIDRHDILPVLDTYSTTYVMYKGGKDINTIAKKRKMPLEKIKDHLFTCYSKGLEVNTDDFIDKKYEKEIQDAIRKYGKMNLTLIKKNVPDETTELDIKYFMHESQKQAKRF